MRDLCNDARIEKIEKKSEVVQKESVIATLMTRRDLGELSRLEFLQRVSCKFLPVPAKRKINFPISSFLHISKHDIRISPYSKQILKGIYTPQ